MKNIKHYLPLLLAALALTAPLALDSCSREAAAERKAGTGYKAVYNVMLKRDDRMDPPAGKEGVDSFIDFQLRAMVSVQNLLRVVEAEHLDTLWQCPPDEAAEVLACIVWLQPIKGTDLADISVKCGDGELADKICKRLVDVYSEERRSMERVCLEGGIAHFSGFLEEQQQKLVLTKQQIDSGATSLQEDYDQRKAACEKIEKDIAREKWRLETLADKEYVVIFRTSVSKSGR